MKQNITHESPGEQPGVYHIPGPSAGHATLCGFVDVDIDEHDSDDHPCDCALCISILKEVKAMKFVKGYFND